MFDQKTTLYGGRYDYHYLCTTLSYNPYSNWANLSRFLLKRKQVVSFSFSRASKSVSGSVYIKKLIEDGASKEDFQIELLGIYSKEECLLREAELAKTSLYPTGLNGNSGKYIEITEEVKEKIKNSMKNRINPFSGGAIQRKRIEDGTHNFLNKESQSKNAKKRVEARTHHLLGGSIQKRSNKKDLKMALITF